MTGSCFGPGADQCPGDGSSLSVGRPDDSGQVPWASARYSTTRPAAEAGAHWTATGTGVRAIYRIDSVAVPIPGAQVTAVQCVAPGGDVVASADGLTGSDGVASFSCPLDHPGLRGRLQLTGPWVSVGGPTGQLVTTSFDFPTGAGDAAVGVAAGRAFNSINYGAPLAAAWFGVQRGPVAVHLDGPGLGPLGARYAPDTDRIEATSASIDSYPFEEAFFKVLHEYGHAFHYVAIGPWGSYRCVNGTHAFEVENTLSCAFVEGFAHFFAGWVGGARLDSDEALPNAASDRVLEENLYRGRLTDGARTPGVVAAFLYDLADGPDSPDGPGNTANGDEAFDGLTVSGNDLVRLMRGCRLIPPAGCPVVDRLDGIDQLVACGAGNPAPGPEGRTWRRYNGVESAVAPLGGQADHFAVLWRRDLYGEE